MVVILEELRRLLIPAGRSARDAVWNSNLLLLAIASGFFLALAASYATKSRQKMPPGPPGLPLVGNVLQLKNEQWFRFSEWRRTYGDIFTLNVLGQPMIVINSYAIAADLLDRRANKFSDRPLNIVGCEIMSDGLMLAFSRYGERWRRMRKAAHEAVNKVPAHGLDEHLEVEALVLARSWLQDPSAWDYHLRRTAANTMFSSMYGDVPLGEADAQFDFITQYNEKITRAIAPGSYWVEILPWMRYIPSRFAPWKRVAEEWYQRANDFYMGLFERVHERIASGSQPASFSSTVLQDTHRHGLSPRENAWLVAGMFGAGAETTAAAMSWWTLAMLAHPEAQRRAQNELDSVVSRMRVPALADKARLPYTMAMVKEVLRWRPVTPVGVPHGSVENDIYNGYFIPKGALIIPNVWEMNNDPALFGADAHSFNPARYLNEQGQLVSGPPDTRDDGHFTYGFGRRICVGKHVANNSLFIEIATCLWAFTLNNVKGQVVDVNAFHDEGIVVRPEPFQIEVEPRFPEAIALLSQECELRGRR
ncbi:unnamed protein product [Peniophora sp. CBMAI 1063]|nr:unnamed protein product [Peniophora sp. CBMAI 1063]